MIEDLLIEFDEMGFAPTTVCPNAEQYAIDWRERVRKEIARLTAENERLRAENVKIDEYRCVIADISEQCEQLKAENAECKARLGKAVELPVKRGDTIYRLIGFIESWEIQEWQVQEIRLLANGKYFLTCGHEGTDDYYGMPSEHFGLWCFTDRSEAEARLAELRGK